MSRRVYEIARELNLDTKEVIGRLNEAGVEVKHHSASVEDPVYERVFGDGAQNGRSETQEEPVAAPEGGRKKEKKRRRVVIDASATSRGTRPMTAPAPKEKTPVVEKVQEIPGTVRVEPGATVKDLGDGWL